MRKSVFRRTTEEGTHTADSSLYSASNIGTRVRRTRGSTTDTPRWVKVFVLIAIILIVLFVILHLTGNGFGPHMHMSTIAHGVQPQ